MIGKTLVEYTREEVAEILNISLQSVAIAEREALKKIFIILRSRDIDIL